MKQISKCYVAVTVVTCTWCRWSRVTCPLPSSCSCILPSFLFNVRHNMDLPPPTVCQCLALITQPIVRLSRTLGPSTPRWRQLTPHNHQGQDNNLFVQDHLCLVVLLCLCQQSGYPSHFTPSDVAFMWPCPRFMSLYLSFHALFLCTSYQEPPH